MATIKYQNPIKTASGKLYGKKTNISQRKLFGVYDSSYCYQNKPDHWSDAQALHRQKMGTASLYAKLLLQDPDFAARVTAARLSFLRRATNPRSAADKQIKPYLRNQQMLTSLIYNRLSTDETFAAPLLDGYARYRACPVLDRPALLTRLAEELAAQSPSLKSIILK